MADRRAESSAGSLESAALLLRSVPQGDSSAIATYFTELHGKVTFVLRGVRASRRRMPLALEPFHTLRLRYKPRAHVEMWSLEAAELSTARLALSEQLDASFAAGCYLRWLAALCAPRQADRELFAECTHQLDALAEAPAQAWLVQAGVRLMAHAGYQLELRRCVGCGRPRPEGRAALASTERGGVVCRQCADGAEGPPIAAPWTLPAAALAVLAGAAEPEGIEQARRYLEAALLAHAEVEQR